MKNGLAENIFFCVHTCLRENVERHVISASWDKDWRRSPEARSHIFTVQSLLPVITMVSVISMHVIHPVWPSSWCLFFNRPLKHQHIIESLNRKSLKCAILFIGYREETREFINTTIANLKGLITYFKVTHNLKNLH